MRIIIDQKRVQNEIPSGIVLDAMDGANPRAVLEFISFFIVDDDGNAMPKDAGLLALREMPFAQIGELMEGVRKATQDILVPPASARD